MASSDRSTEALVLRCMIGYAKHCKETLMYISVPIGENAFYEKNKTRGARWGTLMKRACCLLLLMPARGFEPVPRPAENRVDILPKTRKNKKEICRACV